MIGSQKSDLNFVGRVLSKNLGFKNIFIHILI